jgi:hypothetical protein
LVADDVLAPGASSVVSIVSVSELGGFIKGLTPNINRRIPRKANATSVYSVGDGREDSTSPNKAGMKLIHANHERPARVRPRRRASLARRWATRTAPV